MPVSDTQLESYRNNRKEKGRPYFFAIIVVSIFLAIGFSAWAVEVIQASENGFTHDEIAITVLFSGLVFAGFGIDITIYLSWQRKLEIYRQQAFQRWIKNTYGLELTQKDILLLLSGHMIAQGDQLVSYIPRSSEVDSAYLIDRVTQQEFVDPSQKSEKGFSSSYILGKQLCT